MGYRSGVADCTRARVADPYQGYAPVPLGKPLRFFQVWSKLYLSNDLTSGNINIRYEGIQYNQVVSDKLCCCLAHR